MDSLAFPKPEPRKKIRHQHRVRDRKDLATFHFQVLAADGYRCMAKEVGCQCSSGCVTHHINYRSHAGDDSVENGITLCPTAHDHVHNGIKIGGVLFTGRAYMLQILRSHRGKRYFRWHDAIKELERRYGDADDSQSTD